MLSDIVPCPCVPAGIPMELCWSTEKRRQNEKATEAPELLYQINCAPLPSPSDSNFKNLWWQSWQNWEKFRKSAPMCVLAEYVCVMHIFCRQSTYWTTWLYFYSKFSWIITKWQVIWLTGLFLSVICHGYQNPGFSRLLLTWPRNLS